jgi:uncharacterized protein YegJ (DUF2314 family)
VTRDAGTILPGEPAPAGSLVADRFFYTLAIYHLPVPRADPLRELKKLLRGRPIALVDSAFKKAPPGPMVILDRPALSKYAPPDLASRPFAARGLSDSEKDLLAKTRAVTVLAFAGPGDRALETYRLSLQLVNELSLKVGGLAWDETTRQVFGKEEWAKRAAAFTERLPDMRSHVVVELYRDGELFRLDTMGMGKFALPDVSVNDVSSSDSDKMGLVVNLACQTLIEKGRLDQAGSLPVSLDDVVEHAFGQSITTNIKPNAKRHVTLTLAAVQPHEGDADNRLLEIVFPGPVISLQERQNATITDLFGSSDEVAQFKKHDERVLAASRRAKKAAFRLRERWAEGPPFGERLMVKAPFKTSSDDNEWMWVEVVRWKGDTIEGILQNDPYWVPDLRAGARVEVRADAIFDYLHKKADGSEEGNETAKYLQRADSEEK